MVAGGAGSPRKRRPDAAQIDLHRVTTPWGEGTVGAGGTAINGTGQGSPANAGDATWGSSASQHCVADLWRWRRLPEHRERIANHRQSAQRHNAIHVGLDRANGQRCAILASNPSQNDGWILINTSDTATQAFRAFFTRGAAPCQLKPLLFRR